MAEPQQQLLAQAAPPAAARLNAEPSKSLSQSLSQPSSGSSGTGGLDHSLLSTLSELLQAARAAGLSDVAEHLPQDMQQQLQQALNTRAAGVQMQAAPIAARSTISQAAASQTQSVQAQPLKRPAATAASQALGPATAVAGAQTGFAAGLRQAAQQPLSELLTDQQLVAPSMHVAVAASQSNLAMADTAAAQAQIPVGSQVCHPRCDEA